MILRAHAHKGSHVGGGKFARTTTGTSLEVTTMVSKEPPWALGLHRCGLYYEGVVSDLEKTLHGTSSQGHGHLLWH